MRLRSVTVVLVLALVLAACSVARTAYERADWLIQRNLRQYVSWEGEQREALRQRLDEALDWHRETQLPLYSEALQALRADLAASESGAVDWQPHIDRGAVFWRNLLERVQPDIVAMLAMLSDAQVDELLANLEERSEERLARNARRGAEGSARDLRRQVQRWTGRLDTGQRALIEDWSRQQRDLGDFARHSQAQWRAAFAEALTLRRSDPAAFAEQLDSLLTRPDTFWSEDYAAAIAGNTARSMALLDDLHASLDARQRRQLDRRLREWAELFDDLSRG